MAKQQQMQEREASKGRLLLFFECNVSDLERFRQCCWQASTPLPLSVERNFTGNVTFVVFSSVGELKEAVGAYARGDLEKCGLTAKSVKADKSQPELAREGLSCLFLSFFLSLLSPN